MKVVLFGATGMVGQGVLRECLLDPGVEMVLSVGRRGTGQSHEKLRELVKEDLSEFASVAGELAGYDACFFCLGISSVGMNESDYRKITRDIAVAAANVLVEKNPNLTFIFVSGQGTDSSEKGSVMWARVKGEAENAILALPFRGKYAFRPGVIRPMHGITSRTAAYRIGYIVMAPIMPLLTWAFPKNITTTERIGRAMLNIARNGYEKPVLENPEINAAATPAP
jgi:uncharacterized protein YbjT (DUF2867 family)